MALRVQTGVQAGVQVGVGQKQKDQLENAEIPKLNRSKGFEAAVQAKLEDQAEAQVQSRIVPRVQVLLEVHI